MPRQAASIPASDLALLSFRRWGIELHFREIKIHLNMDVLRCLSPHMIERELRMHFIAYNLIRCVMQKAALTHDVDLKRLSFKGCLDTVRQFANATCGAEDKPRTISALVEEMLLAIARDLRDTTAGTAGLMETIKFTRPMGNEPRRFFRLCLQATSAQQTRGACLLTALRGVLRRVLRSGCSPRGR